MDDGLGNIKIVRDHFQVPNQSESPRNRSEESPPGNHSEEDSCSPGSASSSVQPRLGSSLRSRSCLWPARKLKTAALMLNLFSLPRLPWSSSTDSEEKVEISAAELENLKAELADLEEREAYLKAQLEHVDEVLRSARLAGYLHIRWRWTALPGEPPPIDDAEVDDWLPRFVVLHGACIFLYLMCSDLSPQDSTLLSDIVELGALPNFTREDGETRYSFYILTRQGLRYECSSSSRIQVDSWLKTLQSDCKLDSDAKAPNGMS